MMTQQLFKAGDSVKILKGRAAGKTGVVQGWKGDRVEVKSDSTGNVKLFDPNSIGLNLPDNPPPPQPEPETAPPIEQFKRGDFVRVTDPQQPGLKGGKFKINSVTGTGAWLDTTAVLGRTSFVQKGFLYLADEPLPGSIADIQAKSEAKKDSHDLGGIHSQGNLDGADPGDDGYQGSADLLEADLSHSLLGNTTASAELDSPQADSGDIARPGDLAIHADIVDAELCDDLESRLTELEVEIQEATEAIRQAGYRLWVAAAEIRSRELWALPRDESGQPIHASFAEYGQSRWGWGRSYTHEIAAAGETVAALRQSGIPDSEIPSAASVMRELAKAPPDERPKVLQQTRERWGTVTAAAVRSIVAPSPTESTEPQSGIPDSDDPPVAPPIAPQGSVIVRLKCGPALAKLIEKYQGELYSAIVETEERTFVVQPEAIGVEVVKS